MSANNNIENFKAGDIVECLISYPSLGQFTAGKYYTVSEVGEGWVNVESDDSGDPNSWFSGAFKLHTPPFDPTKLRKGDRVLVEFEVEKGEVDFNEEIRTVETLEPGYMPIKKIIGYAPGYTPTPDPIPDEWAKAYAEAYPDRVREYVRDKMGLSE